MTSNGKHWDGPGAGQGQGPGSGQDFEGPYDRFRRLLKDTKPEFLVDPAIIPGDKWRSMRIQCHCRTVFQDSFAVFPATAICPRCNCTVKLSGKPGNCD